MNIHNLISNNYDKLSLEEQQLIHNLFLKGDLNNTSELYQKLKNIIFRLPPPTPAEYLNSQNGWITRAFEDSIYANIKEDFCEILDKEKNYDQVVEYGSTRQGKSFLSRLIIHYIIIYVHCLRHPQLYYGLAPTTSLAVYIMSFVTEKINQLLLKPIYDLLIMSPRFIRVKFQDQVAEEQARNGLNNIYWSKASTFGKITLESKLSLNIGTDFLSFLGADLLFLSVSEIAFFIEQAGTTHEEIFQLYSDGLERIRATVGNNYLGMVYLDTSANDTDNKIENYILNDLSKQKKVFFRRRSRWEARPYLFPEWQKTKETFKVCIGDKKFPIKIIGNETDIKEIPKNIIIDVPIDVLDDFRRNTSKSIKDIAGIPTKKENKFITNIDLITNIFNNPVIQNIESMLYADSSEMPEQLLWNQIVNKFFIKYNQDFYTIKRAEKEPRYIGLDLAHSIKGDVQGITMLHKEYSTTLQKTLYISDFSFAIGGRDKGINLEAITYLIMDLINIGNIGIRNVYVDQFQSQTLIQFLERCRVTATRQSVDRILEPYQTLYTLMLNELVKSGRNIFLKNNLDSLIETSRKDKSVIDHTQGNTENQYNGDFVYSKTGINAKDVSDSLCQATWGAFNDLYKPSTIYEEENMKFSDKDDDKKILVSKAFQALHKYY